MTQTQMLKKMQRAHWRTLQRMIRQAYLEGFEAGVARAHGQRRRGRTIRADSTVEGLVEQITRHFGLERYGFEVRVTHGQSGRRLPNADQIRRYRLPE